MTTTKKQGDTQQLAQETKEEKKTYFDYLIELEEQKFRYNTARRTLILYRNIVFIDVFVFIACLTTAWIIGSNNFFFGWVVFVAIVAAIFFIILFIYFLVDGWEGGERYGFYGWARVAEMVEFKRDIEQTEILIRIFQRHQDTHLAIQEQSELYKDTLRQVIQEYQRKANYNRWTYFIIQMVIIGCSLLVGGLTSGLNNFISIFGNHLLAPVLSFTVSFLTAIITLFRPRERGFNLQQTADAIQYEIDCATRRIYGYKGLSTDGIYVKLSEEVERLRNEQRKRQQQLEQASDARQANT